MLKNQIIPIAPRQAKCPHTVVESAAEAAISTSRRWGLLMIGTLILWPGNHAWAAAGKLFLSASYLEIGGSLLLTGLSLTALTYGIRLVFRSIRVRPIR